MDTSGIKTEFVDHLVSSILILKNFVCILSGLKNGNIFKFGKVYCESSAVPYCGTKLLMNVIVACVAVQLHRCAVL